MKVNYGRQIIAMDDTDLEMFVDQWMGSKTANYFASERFSGTGDLGRDVVGYCTDKKLAGAWHNFQCKQLSQKLGEAAALLELGKIIAYSADGHYSLPSRFVFVAPHGVTRAVQNLLADPTKLKRRVIEKWDDWCAKQISQGKVILLSTALLAKMEQFDFSSVCAMDAAAMLKDSDIKPVLVRWFGEDPGAAPAAVVPADIQPAEETFISQLIAAYGEREGSVFSSAAPVLAHETYGEHLRLQRQRYFDAASFQRYYRDNTPHDYVQAVEDDVYHGVVDVYRRAHVDVLNKVDEVMSQAACVQPSGVLSKYARTTVKQGICHHLANEGKMPWKK
jgi:hypothetical protein